MKINKPDYFVFLRLVHLDFYLCYFMMIILRFAEFSSVSTW